MADTESGVTQELPAVEDMSTEQASQAIEALLKRGPAPEIADIPQDDGTADGQADNPENASEEAQAPAQEAQEVKAETPPAPKAQPVDDGLKQAQEKAQQTIQQAEAARNQFVQALNHFIPQLQNQIAGEFSDIKTEDDLINLGRTDPVRFNEFQLRVSQLQRANFAKQQAEQQAQQQEEQRMTEWRQGELKKLVEKLPALADGDKGKALAKEIEEYAAKQGYTSEQLQRAGAGDWVMLHKAMQLDKLEAQKAEAQKKAKDAPPVQKPGSTAAPRNGKAEQYRADLNRLKENPNDRDAAAAMFRHVL